MLRRIVECVPNFSEGRDPQVIQEIADAIRAVPGILLLGQEQDEDHHRAVITFVGSPDSVVEAAVRAAQAAKQRIDLRRHSGVHPRIGALDVLPFIPVQNVTLADCAALAERAAAQIWERCGIPCYLYEAAARREDRRNLAEIRKGGFEALLRELPSMLERRPDVGGPLLHPSAGAVAVGARKFLIAWNVLLRTRDLAATREIASLVRQSSGGFPFVKALGLPLASRGITQVSMNLLDFEETPMQPVFDVIRQEAAKRGIEVIGSELIGFLPRKALEANVRNSLQFLNLSPERVLENRIEGLETARFHSSRQAGSPDHPAAILLQATELIGQAAEAGAIAMRLLAGSEKQMFLEQAERDCEAVARSAQEAAREIEKWANGTTEASTGEVATCRAIDSCLDLKTRLATLRQLFSDGSALPAAVYRFQMAQHLADAGLRAFLLGFPPNAGLQNPRDGGADSRMLESRLQVMREMAR